MASRRPFFWNQFHSLLREKRQVSLEPSRLFMVLKHESSFGEYRKQHETESTWTKMSPLGSLVSCMTPRIVECAVTSFKINLIPQRLFESFQGDHNAPILRTKENSEFREPGVLPKRNGIHPCHSNVSTCNDLGVAEVKSLIFRVWQRYAIVFTPQLLRLRCGVLIEASYRIK